MNTEGDFKNSGGGSTSSNAGPNFKIERADWQSFRTVEGLQQKSGVAAGQLRRLVLKEIADNALDAGAKVPVGELPGGGYFVEDEGPGIDGTSEQIARAYLASVVMISTKLLRLPTRGALGNGFRVVAGAVWFPRARLSLSHGVSALGCSPQRDGTTKVVTIKRPSPHRVLGSRLALVRRSRRTTTKSHCTGRRPDLGMHVGHGLHGQYVAVLVRRARNFTNCFRRAVTGRCVIWSPISTAVPVTQGRGDRYRRRLGRASAGRQPGAQAAKLLQATREATRSRCHPTVSAVCGPDQVLRRLLRRSTGTVDLGWLNPGRDPVRGRDMVRPRRAEMDLIVCVNRTPVAGAVYATRDKRTSTSMGAVCTTLSRRLQRTK